MSYTVKAPLLIAKNEQGADVYLYADAPVPSNIKGEQLQRFLDEEFIVEDGKDEAPKPRRAAAKKDDSES